MTPNADLERFVGAFERANICSVNIGLESGSERVRRDVLKRYYSNADVLRTVHAARAHGMQVALYNLVGLPGETRRDFLETARMNRLCRPDSHRTSIFFPYPGTELHRLCQGRGWLPATIPLERERRQAALDLPGFARRRIQECFDFFDLYVAHPNPLIRRSHIVLAKYCGPVLLCAERVPGYWRLKRYIGEVVTRLRRLIAAGPKLERIENLG